MGQLTLRIPGEGISVAQFNEGDTLSDVLGARTGGTVRINTGSGPVAVENPGSYLAVDGSIVDYSPAVKAG